MTESTKRTKGEWKSEHCGIWADESMIGRTYWQDGNVNESVAAANAAFICKAVNNHDKLVEMVEKLLGGFNDEYTYNSIEAMNIVTEARKLLGEVR